MILLSTLAAHTDGPVFGQEVCGVIASVSILAAGLAYVICVDAHHEAHHD